MIEKCHPRRSTVRRAVKEICRRHNCEAVLTRKRCLENYLHPDAIRASADIEIDVDNCGYVRRDGGQGDLPARTRDNSLGTAYSACAQTNDAAGQDGG